MAKVILQVNFDLDYSKNEDIKATIIRAHKLLDLPGLIWKVWLRDRKTGRGGGIYLFDNRASAEAWIKGGFSQFKAAWLNNTKYDVFEIDEELSQITGTKLGPLLAAQRQSAEATA